MWPHKYLDWARAARPLVLRQVLRMFELFYKTRQLHPDVADLSRQAVQHAFAAAHGHRRCPGYFQDEAEFRRWVISVACREAMRLLLLHEEQKLRFLPIDQRRLLEMMYVDQLPVGDIAAVFGMTHDEVRQRNQVALDAFRALL